MCNRFSTPSLSFRRALAFLQAFGLAIWLSAIGSARADNTIVLPDPYEAQFVTEVETYVELVTNAVWLIQDYAVYTNNYTTVFENCLDVFYTAQSIAQYSTNACAQITGSSTDPSVVQTAEDWRDYVGAESLRVEQLMSGALFSLQRMDAEVVEDYVVESVRLTGVLAYPQPGDSCSCPDYTPYLQGLQSVVSNIYTRVANIQNYLSPWYTAHINTARWITGNSTLNGTAAFTAFFQAYYTAITNLQSAAQETEQQVSRATNEISSAISSQYQAPPDFDADPVLPDTAFLDDINESSWEPVNAAWDEMRTACQRLAGSKGSRSGGSATDPEHDTVPMPEDFHLIPGYAFGPVTCPTTYWDPPKTARDGFKVVRRVAVAFWNFLLVACYAGAIFLYVRVCSMFCHAVWVAFFTASPKAAPADGPLRTFVTLAQIWAGVVTALLGGKQYAAEW